MYFRQTPHSADSVCCDVFPASVALNWWLSFLHQMSCVFVCQPAPDIVNLPLTSSTCPSHRQPAPHIINLPLTSSTCPSHRQPAPHIVNLPLTSSTCAPCSRPSGTFGPARLSRSMTVISGLSTQSRSSTRIGDLCPHLMTRA